MKNILQLTNSEAKEFFLKNESYCNIDLPKYFSFEKLLKTISKELGDKAISDYYKTIKVDDKEKPVKPENYDNINHKIVGNKDGQYAWRSFELINPVLYVDFVNKLTDKKNWSDIVTHLTNEKVKHIKCLSIPILSSNEKKKDKAEQILNWWHQVEQNSLKMALEYNHVILTDISNCYDSIYTHSIPWALHGIEESKRKKKTNSLLGNVIDKAIRDMRYGQTNGIPTGSVVMDLIAEIVLAGIDKLLDKKLSDENIEDYEIIRYRDDYRIFVKDSFVGNKILKILSEILYKYNFRLNSSKTEKGSDIILTSVKKDKVSLLELNKDFTTIQKELLVIYKFSKSFPNSGSLVRALNNLYDKITQNKEILKKENIDVLVSIIVQIMFENPRITPLGTGLLSLLLTNHDEEIEVIVNKILSKFNIMPNTGLLEIWLQRLTLKLTKKPDFSEPLAKQIEESDIKKIWCFDWLSESDIKKIIEKADIIDKNKLDSMEFIIFKNEFDAFEYMD